MINFAVKLLVTAAMEAAQVAMQASKRSYGPRLDELKVTTAEFGTPIPRFLGARLFACPVFHAEDLKEVQQDTKVKGGGKQTTYHYRATFACAIADNPIDKVLKIWFDDKVVYDVTGVGPVSLAPLVGSNSGGPGDDITRYMRIYYGTETQLPDPRYVTFCEDKFGPNSAPAYRGISYLFFEELPVDNFGNRIPTIQVLAVSSSSSNYPYEEKNNTASYTSEWVIGGEWVAHYTPSGDPIEWWDAASRTVIGESAGSGVAAGTVVNLDLAQDGTAYFVGQYISGGSAFSALYTCPPLGAYSKVDVTAPWFSGPNRVFDLADGSRFIFTGVPTSSTGYCSSGALIDTGDCGREASLHGDGSVWGIFHPTGTSNAIILRSLTGSGLVTVTGLVTRTGPGNPAFCHVAADAQWFIISDGKWYAVNDNTTGTPGTIKASGTWSGFPDNLPRKDPQAKSFWSGFSKISTEDGSTIKTVDPNSWIAQNTNSGAVAPLYDPINNAIWVQPQFATEVTIRYLDRVGGAGVTLKSIIDAMCDAAGLATADRDTTALTQTVAGYSWTRGDVKSQMDPLLTIHDVDARPHDFLIQFLPRGSSPAGTILTQDFAKSGKDSPRYKVTIKQDTDLPQIIRVNFADTAFDQQTNNVLTPLATDSVDTANDIVIDASSYADTSAGAQQKADRLMRRDWNEREQIENSLTTQQLALEPGDVTTLNLDGIAQNVRLTKQTLASGLMSCTFVRDEISLASLNSATTGPGLGRTVQTIAIPAPVRGFVVDAPFRQDADNDARPLLYAGVGTYSGLTYPGAVIFEASGAGTSRAYDTLFDTVPSGATWGVCKSTLAAVPSPWLWDRGNTLTVALQEGSLTSVAESDIDADPTLNLILVGRQGNWEYLNFATATLNLDGTYTLSDLKRGRRGTEWACGVHQAGEAFVFAKSLDAKEMGLDDVGVSESFKAQAIGRSLDTAQVIDVAPYTGATLKPYAPASIAWSYDGTNLSGTITRRTRIGGAWVGGTTIPLSEVTEAYDVDVYNGSTFKRTISITGTNVFTYTAAMAAADGITLPTPPSVNVCQISGAVGRGFALAA